MLLAFRLKVNSREANNLFATWILSESADMGELPFQSCCFGLTRMNRRRNAVFRNFSLRLRARDNAVKKWYNLLKIKEWRSLPGDGWREKN